jgi:hypothetical protein
MWIVLIGLIAVALLAPLWQNFTSSFIIRERISDKSIGADPVNLSADGESCGQGETAQLVVAEDLRYATHAEHAVYRPVAKLSTNADET